MRRHEAGFTLVPALWVGAILLLLVSVYLFNVFSIQTKFVTRNSKVLSAQSLGEYGFQRATSLLAQAASDRNILAINYPKRLMRDGSGQLNVPDCGGHPDPAACYETQNNSTHTVNDCFIYDDAGKLIGSYDLTIEDGSAVSGITTKTGGVRGEDRYKNAIWYNQTDKNYDAVTSTFRYGVQVDAYQLGPGNTRDRSSAYRLYAVVTVNAARDRWRSPGDYLVSKAQNGPTRNELQIGNLFGWWGPIQANGPLSLFWQGNQPEFSPITPFNFKAGVQYSDRVNRYRHNHYLFGIPFTQVHALSDIETSASNFIASGSKLEKVSPQSFALDLKSADFKKRLLMLTDPSKSITSSEAIPNPALGYYYGDTDFRATFFGKRTRYSDTGEFVPNDPESLTLVYVDDNPTSATYGQVRSSAKTGFRTYDYREIPPNRVIFVNEGRVQIGNYVLKSTVDQKISGGYVRQAPNVGLSTMVDGPLTIVAYSAVSRPSRYNDGTWNDLSGNGDIQIVGNIFYRNSLHMTSGGDVFQKGWLYDPKKGKSAVTDMTEPDGRLKTERATPSSQATAVGTYNGLSLIASNDIKLQLNSVIQTKENLLNAYKEGNDEADAISIDTMLVAGGMIREAIDSGKGSRNTGVTYYSTKDRVDFYGAAYSPNTIQLTDLHYSDKQSGANLFPYFNQGSYVYDRSLSRGFLNAIPHFDDGRTYLNLPVISPGTWIQQPVP